MTINAADYRNSIFAFLSGTIELDQLSGVSTDEKAYVDMLVRTEQRCGDLYDQVYRAKERLFQRLHTEEDTDIICVYENLMDIVSEMSTAMFESGVQYAHSFPEGSGRS